MLIENNIHAAVLDNMKVVSTVQYYFEVIDAFHYSRSQLYRPFKLKQMGLDITLF